MRRGDRHGPVRAHCARHARRGRPRRRRAPAADGRLRRRARAPADAHADAAGRGEREHAPAAAAQLHAVRERAAHRVRRARPAAPPAQRVPPRRHGRPARGAPPRALPGPRGSCESCSQRNVMYCTNVYTVLSKLVY